MRVLIIDGQDQADSLQPLLQDLGHEVEVAYSSAEGREKALDLRPDMILCEVVLPHQDGMALCRELREEPALADARFVAVTGRGDTRIRAAAMHSGFERLLLKPVDSAVWLALLQTGCLALPPA